MAVGQSLGFATAYALSIEAALILPILLCGPAAAYQLREKHQEAELTVQNIHDQLDALDPAIRPPGPRSLPGSLQMR